MTISEIGEKVLLANASMTSAVDRLEQRSFVVRQNSDTDPRIRIVDLTKGGRSFISDLYARHARDTETVTKVLSEREQNELRTLLKKLGLAAATASERRRAEPSIPKTVTKKEAPRRSATHGRVGVVRVRQRTRDANR